jgi:hypothetical protein
MSSVEVNVSVEVSQDCEIRSTVNPRTFTDQSVLLLGFSRRSFAQFMEHRPSLQAMYEVATCGPRP